MVGSREIFDIVFSSKFGVMTDRGELASFKGAKGGIEIDRIYEKYNGENILSIRFRNTSKNIIKIYSFVIADFILPREIEVGKVLENNWLQCSEISYKSLDQPSVLKKVFLQRDRNPFSFKKEYGYLDGSIVSEWFTDIDLKKVGLFIGAVTTADQFAQVFLRRERAGIRIKVTSQFDGLSLTPGQIAKSEKIFFRVGSSKKSKMLFAQCLAKFMKVKKVLPPLKSMCCSYYWNGNDINNEIIEKELGVLEALPQKLKLDYFELDAGYTKYFGDWTDYKDRFPNGFGEVIRGIKSLGYKAGIWLSPFAVNPGTHLHDYHSNWFIKGFDHGHFDGRLTSPLDTLLNITDLEVLDPTKEEVREYLKKVLLHFKSLGFEMFKLDFMYPVCLTTDFSKRVTRAQALRQGLEFIREILGMDVVLWSCITQLSPVVGIVDCVRTGIDTLNPFVCGIPKVNSLVNDYMLENNIDESQERLFLNGIVWRADPDMLIFRSGTGIPEGLLEKHRNFAMANEMTLSIGDSIAQMTEKERNKLVSFFNSH